jgi:hypothetical protein
MLIAGLVCVCAAAVLAALGLRSLWRPVAADTTQLVMRSVAPPRLAAAVMLGAGGAMALGAPHDAGLHVVGVCVGVCIVGAVGTVAAGAWQSARYALRRDAAAANCRGDCPTCTFACR